MAVNIGSGQTSVTGSVTTTIVNADTKKTVTVVSGTANNNTVTLGTVPASKVWRIVGIQMSRPNGTGSYPSYVLLNGVTFAALADRSFATYGSGAQAVFLRFDYYACPVLTSTQTAQLQETNGDNCFAAVHYVQEDA